MKISSKSQSVPHPKKKKWFISSKKNCFKCGQDVEVKFVIAKKNFSQKNNWGYWTEKEENKDKYVCSTCLRRWYCQQYIDFCQQVVNPKKIQNFRNYLSSGTL